VLKEWGIDAMTINVLKSYLSRFLISPMTACDMVVPGYTTQAGKEENDFQPYNVLQRFQP
jgi:hypothetical protein